MHETYKTIPDFKNYAISDLGNVKRITDGVNTYAGKILTPYVQKDGYVRIQLIKDGKKYRFYLHRLLLQVFIGTPPTINHQASHQDGNRLNNTLTNLKWETPKENYSKRVLHGNGMDGEFGPGAKLTDDDVFCIRKNYAAHRSGKKKRATRGFRIEISKKYGISPSHVNSIIGGKTWKNLL